MDKYKKCLITISQEDVDWVDLQAERTGVGTRAAYIRLMIRRERQEASGEVVHPVAARHRGANPVAPQPTRYEPAEEIDQANYGADPEDVVSRALAQADHDGLIEPPRQESYAAPGSVEVVGQRRLRTSAMDWRNRAT